MIERPLNVNVFQVYTLVIVFGIGNKMLQKTKSTVAVAVIVALFLEFILYELIVSQYLNVTSQNKKRLNLTIAPQNKTREVNFTIAPQNKTREVNLTFVTQNKTRINISIIPKFQNRTQEFNLSVNLWRWDKYEVRNRNDRLFAQQNWVEYLLENTIDNYKRKKILYYGLHSPGHLVFRPELNCSTFCIIERAKCGTWQNVSNYDAVVSHPNCIESQETTLWENVSKIVPYVYFTNESPISPFYKSSDLHVNHKIFANYYGNADIVTSYGRWIPLGQSELQKNERKNASGQTKNFAEGKTKLVAMFSSNCGTPNGRMDYAGAMQKFLAVDVYGACGQLTCPKSEDQKCLNMLKKEYKFFLAFENANCREYITEKLFVNSLKYDVIPIVMGAHPDDYKSLAPPHSYIHVEDFKSPEDLATYIKMLDENDTLYNSYFDWHGTGSIMEGTGYEQFCSICAMIVYSDTHPHPRWPAGSGSKGQSMCLQQGRWYWKQRRKTLKTV